MALLAIRKINSAKRSPVVVAARTALGVRRGKMHRRHRGRNLPPVRRSGTYRVTRIAAQILPGVFVVIEINIECSCRRCVAYRAAGLVTNVA